MKNQNIKSTIRNNHWDNINEESKSKMASGIAGDIHHLLMEVMGNICLVRSQMKGQNHLVNILETAEKFSLDARNLTRELMKFKDEGGFKTMKGQTIEKQDSNNRSKGKVLFMDDEKMIRDVVSRMLDRIGYSVEFASNGDEALNNYKAAQESGEPFDAVILDLNVPGLAMGGKETIQRLLEIDPDVKGIVSSGSLSDPVMESYKEFGFSQAVAKPYCRDELDRMLGMVIHGIYC